MTVPPPTPRQILAAAERLGMELSGDELDCFVRQGARTMFAYARLDALPEDLPPVATPRTPGFRPTGADNPFNAWAVRTEIAGRPDGPLAGRRLAVKDTICVAGVPMANGASTLQGYVPEFDATVVTRILEAGGTVAGKAACEYFSYSSGSHTAVTGMVENPRRPGYSAGGSSSGSAALVAAGLVDMAVGGDQAGSVRIPSAHCGVYGLKPTWGLVPYTGVMSSEFNVDHVGPITATVDDNAALLEVLAGDDGIDSRAPAAGGDYRAGLDRGIAGLRIGVVEEGFGHRASMAEVDAGVRGAASAFADLGAAVEPVSVPWHRDGVAVWLAFALEGYHAGMMLGNGFGTGHGGLYWTSLADRHAAWRARANELPANLKLGMLLGEHMRTAHGGRYYVKAMNLTRPLRAAYDAALARFDLLLMPTVPRKAVPLPPPDSPPDVVVDLAFENIENTSPFNLTHHPAMSLPCAVAEGCPIGAMLVGRPYDEATIYRAAHAFEQGVDWRTREVRPG